MQGIHAICKACGSSETTTTISAKEQMYGMGGSFTYGECRACHSLTLQVVPEDLAPFYPTDYYSFETPRALTGVKKFIKRFLARLFLFRPLVSSQRRLGSSAFVFNALGSSLRWNDRQKTWLPNYYSWLSVANIQKTSRILDVGCGAGHLLFSLASDGLENLTGIDPFMAENKTVGVVKLLKQDIFVTTGEFDVIIFNHSLEHVADPVAVLARARELLSPNGTIIVRLPITGTHAFKTFGADWVQLDAPRHLWVPAVEGFKKLAERSRLTLESGHFDSSAFQFWGSLQYQKGIPLMAENSFGQNPGKSMFTKKEITAFERHARDLNASTNGDSATFYLKTTD